MTKRMLIDATHAEETRVVVLDGNRLEDFDVETQSRRQLKGNIYLAKVVRVEPSLQAAFVEYGGNRHGFLAFGEIHPDYYQIPVADRQRLIALQEEEARAEEEDEDAAAEAAARHRRPGHRPHAAPSGRREAEPRSGADAAQFAETDGADADFAETDGSEADAAGYDASPYDGSDDDTGGDDAGRQDGPEQDGQEQDGPDAGAPATRALTQETPTRYATSDDAADDAAAEAGQAPDADSLAAPARDGGASAETPPAEAGGDTAAQADAYQAGSGQADATAADQQPMLGSRVVEIAEEAAPPPETIGGEPAESEEGRERRPPPRFLRNYKIQEVIRRRQIMLVQVVKEERGTKGAALTTYISLAGRYCVLMPNSPRGGGISRKITSAADRKRLKEVTSELEIPRGMGLIVRTAGANRPKPEIKRDCEYLLRLWDEIRDLTMQSVAPALIYEEASLIKRAIRDVYSSNVDDILVDGEEGWKAARDFMRMLMPTHAKKVQLWRDGGMPLFARHQVEAQLDAMLQPTVQLRSGGYLVINQTEALVAIDVNSGRSTRERGIEETAVRTNLEAAEEVARQLRLRDLAGLIVIDFIDMESKKNIASVERRLKEALKNDRARIQVGHISHFGLMEMSRQRLRPSLAETSLSTCPHCGGAGHVRSTESAALHVLRAIEEEGGKRRAAEILVHVASGVAFYILNHKRDRLSEIETRYAMRVGFAADESLLAGQTRIERLRAQTASDLPPPIAQSSAYAGSTYTGQAERAAPEPDTDTDADETEDDESGDEAEGGTETAGEAAGEGGAEGERRRRRRRRRRGGRREDGAPQQGMPAGGVPLPPGAEQPDIGEVQFHGAVALPVEAPPRRPPAPPREPEVGPDGAAEPAAEDAETTADGAERGRARRSRGGRRRKPREGEAREVPIADAPAPVPAYAGPTPANPFGDSVLDIFDVIEAQAEGGSLHTGPATGPLPVIADAPIPAPAPAPAPRRRAAPRPIEAAPAVVETAPSVASSAPAEIAAAETTIQAPESPPAPDAPAPAEAAPEPVVGPVIQPIVVDTLQTAEKKRGWWRR